MIGMLQIITYLLCAYLIFKGLEILQIALMSPREDRTFGLVIGMLAFLASIGLAFLFSKMIDGQARSVGNSMSGQ